MKGSEQSGSSSAAVGKKRKQSAKPKATKGSKAKAEKDKDVAPALSPSTSAKVVGSPSETVFPIPFSIFLALLHYLLMHCTIRLFVVLVCPQILHGTWVAPVHLAKDWAFQ